MRTAKPVVPCSVTGQHIDGFWKLTFNTSSEKNEDSPTNKPIVMSFDAEALGKLRSIVQEGFAWFDNERAQTKDRREFEQSPRFKEMVKRQDAHENAYKASSEKDKDRKPKYLRGTPNG
jgi:hypothetical protein